MKRETSFAGLLLLLLGAVAVPCPGWASTATVFQGSFVRATGEPFTEHRSFDGGNGGLATIKVINGNMEDSYAERVSSSVITVNGQVVFSSSDFNQNVSSLEKNVYLSPGSNALDVLLKGKPMGMITVLITVPVVDDKVTITGIVPGTIAEALDANGYIVDKNIAAGSPKRFTLTVKTGNLYSIRFIENEGTPEQNIYSFYNINGANNFSFPSGGITIDLGVLVFDSVTGRATPTTDVFAGTGATQVAVNTVNISGIWQVSLTITSSSCGTTPPIGTVTSYPVLVVQNINSVTFFNALDLESVLWWGTISGNILAVSRIFESVDQFGNVTAVADVEIRALAGAVLAGQMFVTQSVFGNTCLTVNDFLATR